MLRLGDIKAIKDEFSEQGLEGANSSSSRIDRHRESWPFAVSCLWRGGLNLVLIKKRYHRTKSSVTDVQLAFLDNWCRSFCPRIYFQLTFSVALTGRVGIGTNKLETPQFDIRSFRFVSLCPVLCCVPCIVCHLSLSPSRSAQISRRPSCFSLFFISFYFLSFLWQKSLFFK